MPSLSIDGREVTVSKGTTVIQAAEELGIFIPRYCYHPGLSIAGNGRHALGVRAEPPARRVQRDHGRLLNQVVGAAPPRRTQRSRARTRRNLRSGAL